MSHRIKYGGTSIEFVESKKLIGLRSRRGMSDAMAAAVGRHDAKKSALRDGDLGGFKIVEVDADSQNADALLDKLRSDSAVNVGTHVFQTSDDEVPFVPTGELFVVFKPDTSEQQMRTLFDDYSLELVEAREEGEFIVRITRDSSNPIKVAAALQQSDQVDIAEPELATVGQLSTLALPTDTLLDEQWHLRNTGYHRGTSVFFKRGADARVIDAWQSLQGLGSPRIVVAVIDDGFDINHPDLGAADKVVHPYDFTKNSNDPSPDLGDSHGTACAGVAIGSAGGGGIVGAGPNATFMPIRWGPNLSDSQIERWFGHAAENGADIVSCSWKAAARVYALSARAHRAIERCARDGRGGKGCIVVFAAGNDNVDVNDLPGSLNGFATHPDVVAVAACTSRDERSHYSNKGREIWLTAPSSGAGGAGILTSDVTGHVIINGRRRYRGYASGDYTGDFGGTSSACPLVAGVCALILSANPNLTASQVKQILKTTARQIGGKRSYHPNGHSTNFGYGCVDAVAAVNAAKQMRLVSTLRQEASPSASQPGSAPVSVA